MPPPPSQSKPYMCPNKAATKKLLKFHKAWSERRQQQQNKRSCDLILPMGNICGPNGISFNASSFPSFILEQHLPPENNKTIETFPKEEFSLKEVLGQGGFSNVWEAKHLPTEQVFALKQLKPSTKVNKKLLPICAADLAIEMAVLTVLSHHDNIISLKGVSKMQANHRWEDFFLVVEKLEDTLDQRLVQWRMAKPNRPIWRRYIGPSPQEISRRLSEVALGIVYGMEYLHENGIMYR